MTTDITELAQRDKFEAWWEREYKHLESSKYTDAVPHIKYGFWMAYQAGGSELVEELEKAQRHANLTEAERQAYLGLISKRDERIAELEDAEQKLCSANVTLDARAEQAERERENWRTSFDNERFRAAKLKAHIDDIEPIRAAAEKLVRCKDRYHSELNYRALAALFGVTTPDLAPLEHENVHYADAAEMEIAAMRQRIVELESRTVTVKLPVSLDFDCEMENGDYDIDEEPYLRGKIDGFNYALTKIRRLNGTAGIKWEAE